MDDAKLQLQALLPTAIRHRPWIDSVSLRAHEIDGHQALIRAGGSPQRLYFVAKGWLSGSTLLSQKLRPISSLHIRGDTIGLTWLSAPNPVEDVSTLTPAELISVPMAEFRDWLSRDTVLGEFVMREIVRSMMNLQIMSAVAGHMKAPDRLAYFLFIMLKRCRRSFNTSLTTLQLPMTQEEIGRLLGLTNVSVNRAFRSLEAEGLIQTGRQTVMFHNEAAFAERFDLDTRPALIDQLVGAQLDLTDAA
ncbi:Crp/Fnr family transcriptional regulator [Algimonas porphyrae]|uniref:HTH crp-type domain-containing protein n=1 Tax=Algimonas porphyrae TaxID=1128113 RepID=A0ABQ5UZ91_9PROT|nr:Crp/Fnr family transcriptional regulator [Algimonas porphyrae]GLQ20458.1 hypothetical protein GCM10007854_14130 [Algimonas porphyrae]